ncbi:MAG: sodium-dependent transporter [Eubacterium sp.]|nr:sodium-dependent transporter [Eubacterium sp.]
MEREGFKSRLGFILVSAGCAIGIGNVWRFPYMVGQNGGAIFVVLYLVFLAIMGIPVLTMELAVGRASKMTTMRAMKKLQKDGHRWHIYGWIAYGGSALLMMYYTTVSGWMLAYFWKYLKGDFEGVKKEETGAVFARLLDSPIEMMLFMALIVIIGFLVISFGVQKGLERVSKFMMIGLLLLIIVLAVNSLIIKGSGEGVEFYLLPDVSKASEAGWDNVISGAMCQAFFTLSIGIGSMEIFGSYMNRENTLTSESVKIVGLDTFIAIMSGLIIFPACFAFNVEPDQGPSLIFVTLPQIFTDMSGGRIWGTMFFIFMVFASFSTVTAVFENLVRSLMDNLGWTRLKAIAANCVLVLIGSIPCVLGFNVWKNVKLIGSRGVLDSEDFLVGNIILPLGSIIYVIFCTWKFGWGAENYLEETNTGKGMRMSKRLIPYFKYVLPVLAIIVFIRGLM